MAVLLSIGALSAQDSKKWYLSGSIMGDYQEVYSKLMGGTGGNLWSAGVGVAMNRMLGDKFSIGLGVTYASEGQTLDDWGASNAHQLGAELGFAYFLKITDKLYFVPEAAVGVASDVNDSEFGENAFMAGISPLGLEFRPGSEKIGIRLNIVSLAYSTNDAYSTVIVSAKPTLSVCFRF